ncbi:unnamed protein product [Brassica oleracea]|uniref:(rape) hypothetical protein n=1 Tax=Brassica napus TaxID=3708 RepID=A0A816LDJ9_BRANA|nr:unnamed protein product [Brassica napus]
MVIIPDTNVLTEPLFSLICDRGKVETGGGYRREP